jgi:trehalose transport system substrate-binding protein
MRISRRRFAALSMAGSAAFLLAACDQIPGVGRSGGGTGGGGSVTFVTGLAEDERQVVGDLLKQFEKDAGLQVKMVQMESQDVVNQLKAKKSANRMDVDLVAQDNLRLGPLVRDGIVEDLSSHQARVPETAIQELLPVTQFDGKSYFFPYRPNVQITYFNADKLNGYGVKPPETWDELLSVAQTLKDKEGVGKVAIQASAGDALTVTVFEFIKQAGGDPLALNDPGSVQAFEFLQKLEPLLTPEYRTAKFDTMNTILSNDTAYLGSNWPFGITVIVQKNGRKDIKAYHGWRGPAKESHVLGGEVLGLPVGAPNRDGALKVADFLMSKETQGQLLSKLGWPPMRTDAFGSVPDWQTEYFQAVQQSLKAVDARPNVPYWEDASRAMNDAFRDVVQQKQPAKETLDRYAATIQRAKQAQGG